MERGGGAGAQGFLGARHCEGFGGVAARERFFWLSCYHLLCVVNLILPSCVFLAVRRTSSGGDVGNFLVPRGGLGGQTPPLPAISPQSFTVHFIRVLPRPSLKSSYNVDSASHRLSGCSIRLLIPHSGNR